MGEIFYLGVCVSLAPAVEVEGLSKTFKGKCALNRVKLTAKRGEMLALVGSSGSGKSTLLRNINGLQTAESGTVRILGATLQGDGRIYANVRELRSHIGFIFQQFNLVRRLTVIENVLAGRLAAMGNWRSSLRIFTPEEKLQALAALDRVGILDQAYKRASLLSGGQQQRVAIARCLVQGAQIILADEPIASLDPESARKIMELLDDLNRDGITTLVSLHQVQLVRRYFPRAIALRDGEVKFDGATRDLNDAALGFIYGQAADELIVRGHAFA